MNSPGTGTRALDRSVPPSPGALRPFHFPPVQRARLGNGLEIVVAEAHAFPVVTVDLVLPAGGLGESEDLAGVASLTAGLLESGAGERNAGEIADHVDALGLALQTGVSWDTALAGFTALRSRLDPGVALVADLVRHPTFPEREVERIRDERLASLAQRRADPGGIADELLNHHVFSEAVPFHRRLGGTAETLGGLTRADVEGFHSARYRPLGATLAAAGDVTLDEVVALAERYLGDWEGAPPPARVPEVRPRLERTTVLLADRPGAVQSEVRVGHVGVERTHPDYFPLTVMNAILGGTFSSRLNMELRERLGFTYGVSSQWGMRRLPGPFLITAAVQTEGTARSVSEMLSGMRELQETPVSDAELNSARSYLAGVFPLGLQTTDGLASRLSTLVTYDLPDDYYDSYRERLMAVTADDVRRAAREHLRPERAVVMVVGEADRLRPELEALGIGPVEAVAPAELLR